MIRQLAWYAGQLLAVIFFFALMAVVYVALSAWPGQ